jgi:hypothetical protein
MLDGSDHDAGPQLSDGAHASPDGECDRFGAPGREDELVGLGTDRLRHDHASVIDHSARLAARAVDVQGIAERVEGGDERVTRRRKERGG